MDDSQKIRDLISKIDLEKADEEKVLLVNIVELLLKKVEDLEEENKGLKAEIRKLKGGNDDPDIKGKSEGATNFNKKNTNKSKPKGWKKKSKNDDLEIDREIPLEVDKSKLPADAIYKGTRDKTIQGLTFERNNIKLKIERWYSPLENKYYEAEIPANYEDQFSKDLQAFIIMLSTKGNMGHDKIIELLESNGTKISTGQIERILNQNNEKFHEEMDEAFEVARDLVGLMHSDDTGARHQGTNWFTSVLCNHLCTMFKTTPRKNRLTVIKNLTGRHDIEFLVNKNTIKGIKKYKVGKLYEDLLKTIRGQTFNSEEALEEIIKVKHPKITEQKITQIKVAAAYAWLKEKGIVLVKILVTDAAGQFNSIADIHSLCWVHEIRHYKVLNPNILQFKKIQEKFLNQVQLFYERLKKYKEKPEKKEAEKIQLEFNSLFSTETKYEDLNKTIAQTKKRIDGLLVVLKHPEVPLHNNHAEQQIRPFVIKRKIQFGTRSEDGLKSRDTFMSISMTCKKLNLSFFDYLKDRLLRSGKILQLSEIMRLKMAA